ITSSTIRSTSGSSAMRRPVSPSWAIRTSWPSLRILRRRPSAMARSSSMIRMRAIREWTSGCCCWKQDAESAAFAELRLQLDAAAVRLDDLLGDGQPQAGALGLAREQVVAAVEALEDPLAVLGADAGAVVLDFDGDAPSRAARAHPDALLFASVLDGVVQEVQYHLGHGLAIDVDRRQARLHLRVVAGELLRAPGFGDLGEQRRHLGMLLL